MKDIESREVIVRTDDVDLAGNLAVPGGATGIVVFAHGSGSSRFSPRNNFVAEVIQQAGVATLLMDLLTSEEEEVDQMTAELRFNIQLLAERVVGAVDSLQQEPETGHFRIGLFGSSTGAAAALVAAAARPYGVHAVVSRGGRPDLAGDSLGLVQAPTLLLVGGNDDVVIELNRDAYGRMDCEKELRIIPGATHLFAEPGTLEQVAKEAAGWFADHLAIGEQPAAQ
ncbi:dienelactone hydrolase family protein [Vulgatibacter incomptus]|uniref:Dienelactone hydrolase domain-containing protein n=1 Tax=Vulgatibacter incomptus TaxID=1391653 RepID=A0A0K1P9R4_9BACT|nr:dienelactone hydrolase family protein [Vulgatibacter incomptus]AKU90255.1 hypothetical protein AKJ08_0642 [Vulgatibacter incomptus]